MDQKTDKRKGEHNRDTSYQQTAESGDCAGSGQSNDTTANDGCTASECGCPQTTDPQNTGKA